MSLQRKKIEIRKLIEEQKLIHEISKLTIIVGGFLFLLMASLGYVLAN